MLATAGILCLQATEADSLRVMDIEAVTIVAQPKEHTPLKRQPLAVSLLGKETLAEQNVTSIKQLGTLVPNLFIPDYGSSLTSALYIRGIGSRINTPAVGLYVDNMPYPEKSAFDFQFMDVERVDVLRGPQGTLYGRNTMGGLVKIYTTDPLHSPGTDLSLGGTLADMSYYGAINTRFKLNERSGLSLGLYGREARGLHRNITTGKWGEWSEKAGIRMRLVHLANESLKADFTASMDRTDERGYAYRYNGPLTDDGGKYDHLIGQISSNRPNGYRRNLLNTGLNLQWTRPLFTLSSTTSYQWVGDDMRIDQDFLADDIFTLRQRQQIHTLNQELTLKGSSIERRWHWVTGISGILQWNRTNAPVNFYTDGVQMIQQAMDEGMGNSPVKVHITNEEIHIPGLFRTPVKGTALFHQSDIRLAGPLTLTLGLRLDHERQDIRYNTSATVDCLINGMGLTDQAGRKNVNYKGNFHKNQTHLLPRLALNYRIGTGTIYASFSKGVRSGGYNMQMFSEIIQQSFRTQELTPEEVKRQISYAPEWSLNYEAGTHLRLFGGMATMDAALFLIDTHDQQVSRFTPEGLGRILVNAGRTRSWGGELAVQVQPFEGVTLSGDMGYTHATFTHYDGGADADGQSFDHTGNRVPYVPELTGNFSIRYTLPLKNSSLGISRLTMGINRSYVGRIWWTEANDAMQDEYSQLGANFTLHFNTLEVELWGRNLTDTHFDTFRFHSMNRDFSQQGRPRDFGIKMTWRL